MQILRLIATSSLSLGVLSSALPDPDSSTPPWQPYCKIIPPDAIYNLVPHDFDPAGTLDFKSMRPSPAFVVSRLPQSYEVNSLVKFTVPNVGTGPCAIKFHIANPYRIYSRGTQVVNTYAVKPARNLGDVMKSRVLIGSTTFSSGNQYPHTFEVNQPACPNDGIMWLWFSTTGDNSMTYFYQDNHASGLFIFKGDCYGPPVFN